MGLHRPLGEYYALILWSAAGMMLLVAARELLVLFLGLETMALCLYLLTAFEKGRARSAEGGLKYFVFGSVSSALFLFGLSLIYAQTGSTRFPAIAEALRTGRALGGDVAGATALVLVLVGLGFKLSVVPFHQWAPDAYEGAPAPVGAWVATGSKVASVAALLNLLRLALGPWAGGPGDPWWSPGWVGLLAVVSAATMTVGNLAALGQRNFKRLLGYSSIAQAGYLLVGVLAAGVSTQGSAAAGATYYYLIAYAAGTLGAFAAATWLARDLDADEVDDLNGLASRSPLLATCLAILLLSLIGIPPLAGFVGKLAMFAEALDLSRTRRAPLAWLVGVGLLNTVVSAVYYVRVLRALFFRSPKAGATLRTAPLGVWVPLLACTALVVGLGLRAGPALDDLRASAAASEPPAAASAHGDASEPLPTQPRLPELYLPPEGDPPPAS